MGVYFACSYLLEIPLHHLLVCLDVFVAASRLGTQRHHGAGSLQRQDHYKPHL